MESLPNGIFRVVMANGHKVLAYPSAKLRRNLARISVGDKVIMELSPYDLSKGSVISKSDTIT